MTGLNGKAREKLCPRCGEDITDTYQENDGWDCGGWYCDDCETFIADEVDGE